MSGGRGGWTTRRVPKPSLDRHPFRGDFSKVQKSEMSLAKRPRGARGCVLHCAVGRLQHARTQV